ncbi:MAG: DUF3025 domain-containing protein [gamma proteobacterium symbiont of Bathyaustriella thionipta]|nr:DUF3025 domain-containing protein [gamma proteobacterium symbiont of Bathyaustriella thionipta]MCU7949510.1 DUF3025 domain-containing protein [gamma proteobacterium symbiont of Bathyaustriella thionipta]MCU7953225.1 DUF3025 domain-containing protein [gamma proteobacterium symbiont of Bathyaustriella thionipta]MCU7956096.1 DUF3025 domain-containing protein [gamma proteobacterium symbiont of Bathyaustriella thionipta]MCU7967781.1 DUF3025 domain-containing protein [gamma proteobacterium symbion
MAKNIINQWDPDFLDKSLIFSDLKVLLKETRWSDWPGCQGLLALLDEPIILSSSLPLDMKAQDDTLPFPEMGYEERVYKKGIVSTREQNWHDLFNAFIWLLFPKTKVLLNDLHMQELKKQPGKKRTPARDAITHIDESGIIIASSDTTLLDSLKNHQWQEVFVHSRGLWLTEGLTDDLQKASQDSQQMGAFVFGHGMYEKAFKPFVGFTGKAYCIEVDQNFYRHDKMTQYRVLDQLLCDDIKHKNALCDSSSLSPLPILGIPGWSKDNESAEFYDNKHYFRAKK